MWLVLKSVGVKFNDLQWLLLLNYDLKFSSIWSIHCVVLRYFDLWFYSSTHFRRRFVGLRKPVLPNLFFNRGTLTSNHLPNGTLHFWHSFYIENLHSDVHVCIWCSQTKSCNSWLNFSRGITTMLGNSGIVVRDRGTRKSWRSNKQTATIIGVFRGVYGIILSKWIFTVLETLGVWK